MKTENIDIEQYRPGFEAWAEPYGYDIERNGSGYMNDDTTYAFQGWCASKREASTESAEPESAHSAAGFPCLCCEPAAGARTDEAKDAALVEAERAGWRDGMADAQEQLAEEIQKAARYDYLVSQYPCNIADALDCGISEIDEEIDRCIEHDAAIAHTKAQEK